MGRRENALFSLPIAPCARAHHSLPAFARSFLLAPSLPIAFARRNKYEKPVEEAALGPFERSASGYFASTSQVFCFTKASEFIISAYKCCWLQLSYCGLHVRAVSLLGKNQMRFAVFSRISVRFCGFRTPFSSPRYLALALSHKEV